MLKHRLLSGIFLAGTPILCILVLPGIGLWLFALALATWTQLEFYKLMNNAGMPVFRVVGVLCGWALISATFWTIGPDQHSLAAAYRWEQGVMLCMLIAVFVRQFPQKNNDKPLETIACTLFGVLYVAFLLNFFIRLGFGWEATSRLAGVGETGKLLVIYLVVVVKMTDIGAYFTGRFLGKHKLFPRLSPKKTWEGFGGGLVAGVLASLAFCLFNDKHLGVVSFPVIDAITLGAILAVAGVVGDMFESLVKRACSSKDSASSIPGMGGVLDVLDSLLFGAPVMYLYLSLVLS